MSLWYDIDPCDLSVDGDELHVSLEGTYAGSEYAVIKLKDLENAMPNLGTYYNEEEIQFIKEQPEGFVRSLVQMSMKGKVVALPPNIKSINIVEGVNEKIPAGKIKKVVPGKGDGLHTCKQCGYMLPYYKGKCKSCGGK